MFYYYIELAGHLVSGLSFLGVAVYIVHFRRDLRRNAQNPRVLYLVLVSAAMLFGLTNLMRFVVILAGARSSSFGTSLDIAAECFIISQPIILWYLLTNKIVIEVVGMPRRVLAVGAHPDDIEVAAGAALAKMRDEGCEIYGLVLTGGEMGGHGEVRPLEALRGGAFLGLYETRVECFADTRLQAQTMEVADAIERLILEAKPDLILTHSVHDLHQDHRAVYEATLRAARNTPATILCYESPSVTEDFHPSYFVEVCQYANVKLEAIREHWDQRTKPYMRAEVVRGKLAFRGAQAKVDYAEGFEVVRMLSII
jgi:LmbE family N-acetylglucosaminyl deacetylase